MNELFIVMSYAALPAAGVLAGSLLVDRVPLTEHRLSILLHGAAGGSVAIVALEILPETAHVVSLWVVLAAFALGGFLFIGIDAALGMVRPIAGVPGGRAVPWTLFTGMALDLFFDGAMIGASVLISSGLALLLAIGLLVTDAPKTFAAVAALKQRGVTRGARRGSAAVLTPLFLLGAVGGYWALRPLAAPARAAFLVVTAGMLMTLMVEEMIPQAHVGRDGRAMTLSFLGGFSLFTALAAFLA